MRGPTSTPERAYNAQAEAARRNAARAGVEVLATTAPGGQRPSGEAVRRGRETSSYPERLSAAGDARAAGNASPASVESPRCVRIRWITAGSSIVASTTMRSPQRGHERTPGA